MKNILLFIIMVSLIFIGGCNSNQKVIEELKIQSNNNQKAMEALKIQNKILQEQLTDKKKEDYFEKNQDCQRHKTEIEKNYKSSSINLFYSPHYNTCVFEQTSITNNTITSKAILNVFGNEGYVIEQNGQVIYDEQELGYGKTYGEIKEIIKGE